MMIVELTEKCLTLLNAERYAYYKECERKSMLTNKQIREEAVKMFKEWAVKTDFKVDITMLPLVDTFRYSHKTSFFCEWWRDRCIGDKELKDLGFQFERSLNDAVNEFVSEAYKEHRKALEDEFNARMSKRAKSYLRMQKLCVGSFIAVAVLLVAVFIMTLKLI